MVSFYLGYKQFPSCIVCLSTKARQFVIFCGFLYSQLMVRNLFALVFEKLKFNVQLLDKPSISGYERAKDTNSMSLWLVAELLSLGRVLW